jgi:hypothetical protein
LGWEFDPSVRHLWALSYLLYRADVSHVLRSSATICGASVSLARSYILTHVMHRPPIPSSQHISVSHWKTTSHIQCVTWSVRGWGVFGTYTSDAQISYPVSRLVLSFPYTCTANQAPHLTTLHPSIYRSSTPLPPPGQTSNIPQVAVPDAFIALRDSTTHTFLRSSLSISSPSKPTLPRLRQLACVHLVSAYVACGRG